MCMVKEVIFFCYGDSSKASTWSNVPYLFTEALENRDIKVRRVDITPHKFYSILYNRIVVAILGLFYPNTVYSFIRSSLCSWLVNRKVKESINLYSAADLCIFSSFLCYLRLFSNFSKKQLQFVFYCVIIAFAELVFKFF